MEVVLLKVENLVHPEHNARRHSDRQVEELAKSVEMFGQTRPIITDSNGVVWCGNGLLEAFYLLEKTEIYGIVRDDLTESQKKKLMLADNKIFSLGSDNVMAIDEIMQTLDDFDVPGFDEEVLSGLYGELDGIEENFLSYGTLSESAVSKLNNIGEKREEVRAGAVEEVQPRAVEHKPVTVSDDEDEEEEQTEVRRFVKCPHCGEKIWL